MLPSNLNESAISVARSLPDGRRSTSNSAVALCVCPSLFSSHSRTSTRPVLETTRWASDSGRRIRAHAQRRSGRAWPNRPNGPIGGGPAGDSVVRVSEREQSCVHDVICDANVRRGRGRGGGWSVVIWSDVRPATTTTPTTIGVRPSTTRAHAIPVRHVQLKRVMRARPDWPASPGRQSASTFVNTGCSTCFYARRAGRTP